MEKKERKVFLPALGILEEEEKEGEREFERNTRKDEATATAAVEGEECCHADDAQRCSSQTKDLQNGKMLPSIQSIVTFRFFNQTIFLKQDIHSCGGTRQNRYALSVQAHASFDSFSSSSFAVGHLWRSSTILLRYLENEAMFLPDGTRNDELLGDVIYGETMARAACIKEVPTSHFCGKRVLELGSGTGLLGISLSKAGSYGHRYSDDELACSSFITFVGASVVLTDMKNLLPLLHSNVELNGLFGINDSIQVKELFW